MIDSNKLKAPDELYSEYQQTRDNIPQSALNSLRSSAEQHKHEDNIHAILQQAKTVNTAFTSTSVSEAPTHERQSIIDKIRDWFNPALGGSLLAAALIAVVAVPQLRNQGEYQHLSNCSDCLAHVSNASALTRSTSLGQPRIETDAKTAAKLGRISAKLEIAQAARLSVVQSNALNELASLARKTKDDELAALASSKQTNTLIEQLRTRTQEHSAIFNASMSLFLANVSARNAKNNGLNEQVLSSFKLANSNFSEQNPQTNLQRNIADKLEQAISVDQIDNSQLDVIIELTRRAMESLGV